MKFLDELIDQIIILAKSKKSLF